jgi:hypothetical protein
VSWSIYQIKNESKWNYWNKLGGGDFAQTHLEPFQLLRRKSFIPVEQDDPVYELPEFQGELFNRSSEYHERECVDYVYHIRRPCMLEPEFGYAIMDPGILIPQSVTWSFFARKRELLPFFSGVPSPENYRAAAKSGEGVVDEDIVISLRHIFASNYGHCLIQFMPAIRLLDEVGISRDIPIVVSSDLGNQKFFQDMIHRGELSKRRWIIQGDSYIRAKELIFARAEWPSRQLLNDFLDEMDAPYGVPHASRRLFILRNNRNISNLPDLLPEIEKQGYECIRPEVYSFAEQMELFSQAIVVCGVGGAALTNTIFARGNRLRMLEICPTDWQDTFFYGVANICGFEHNYLFGSKFEGDRSSNFSVDPEAFKSFLITGARSHETDLTT